jgi:hypothetical protein
MWQESGTGDKWCLVRIGQSATAPVVPNQIEIKNISGATVEAHRLLYYSSPLVTAATNLAAYQAAPSVFNGIKPTTHWGKYAVTLEEIANNSTGAACISGPCVVEIEYPGSTHSHKYVDIVNSKTYAKEYWYGAGEIMHVETAGSPSKRWATVRLGLFQSPLYQATADEEIDDNSSGDAVIKVAGATKETVTVHNKWMEGTHHIADGDEMMIVFDPNQGWWRVVSLECS